MNKFLQSMPDSGFEFDSLKYHTDELLKTLLNCFADQIDQKIQNEMVSELMAKYINALKKLEETNQQIIKYNDHLEELVLTKVQDITESKIAVIHALVKLSESRDDDTGAHIERTSGYCGLIAEKIREAGLYSAVVDGLYAEDMERASPLHDIGKVGIADAILLKPDRLTEHEFELMKIHVSNGYDTLASVERSYPGNKFLKLGMEISRYHHEKWDGSGYMHGLSGNDIPISARIMALSDVYDALRSKRVYKEAFTHEKSIDIIAQGRGTHFDPVLTDIFMESHEAYREVYDRLTA